MDTPDTQPENVRWILAQEAVCKLGLSQKEASERYALSYDALRKRAQREAWPTPERVSEIVTKASHNRLLAEKEAETWLEKGEAHRAVAFKLAHEAVRSASLDKLPLKDWADLERADKMARRAAGLDNAENVTNNAFSFNYIGETMRDEGTIDGDYTVNTESLPE